jgi:hypothetical protein
MKIQLVFFLLSLTFAKKHLLRRFKPAHKLDMRIIDDVKKTSHIDRNPRALANENTVAV